MEILFDAGNLRIVRLVVGPLDNNAYIISSAGSAVVVDAAAEPDRILAAAEGSEVRAVLTTHGHHDHIGAVEAVRGVLGVPFRLHPADAAIAGLEPDEPLRNGEEVAVGEHSLTVIHTPGHTPGSVSFLLEGHLFTGDTLFPGGPGATRFPYSSFDSIMESLTGSLFVHRDETVVYPGHGATTTLQAERPHLEEWRARGW